MVSMYNAVGSFGKCKFYIMANAVIDAEVKNILSITFTKSIESEQCYQAW